MYYSKRIGVFVSHIYGPYQKELCQGIIDKAASYGYLVEIFASNDGENFGYNKIGESSILRIPNFDKFSGIIFASGTYPVPELRDTIYKTLKEKSTCPIIEVNQNNPAFPSVALDNDIAIIPIIDHLIKTHKYKRICYLGSKYEKFFSNNRYNYYLETMRKNHLTVANYDYYSCHDSSKDIEKAIEFFMKGNEKPEAIVCYNDNMALKLITSLIKRNYDIPEDIAITGFDALEFGQSFNPPLSSVSFPIRELGFAAVEKLIKEIYNEPTPPVTMVKAKPIIGGTCGCKKVVKENPLLYSHQLLNENNATERFLIEDINMSSILHGITDIDDGIDLLEKYVSLIENCYEFHLCLYGNWDSLSHRIQKITSMENAPEDDKSIYLKLSIKDGKRLHECSFTNNSSLPDYIYKDSKSAFIYSPLFFNDLEFGYIAISYKKNQLSYPFHFNSWIMNVNRMLKHICDTKQMALLVNRLESLHQKDELTGFYNKYTFQQLASELINTTQDIKKAFILIALSLDNVRNIIEDFGYKELNFAIQVVGHALKSSLEKDSLCAHIAQGRFYFLFKSNSKDKATNFVKKVDLYLENYNKLQTKSYPISVSTGYDIKSIDSTTSLDGLIENAEKNMYREQDKKSTHNTSPDNS